MTSATMAEREFGDLNSAFPNNESGEEIILQSSDAVCKDVKKSLPAGAYPPQTDDFSMNWEFEDFKCFPTVPFCPSTLGTLADIPPLPEDLQVEFCHSGDDTMNIVDPTSRQTTALQQTKQGVDTARAFAASVNKESIEFRDFEYSTELHVPWKNNQPELVRISSVSSHGTMSMLYAHKTFVTLHNFSIELFCVFTSFSLYTELTYACRHPVRLGQ